MDLFDVGFIVYIYNILYIINIYIYKYIYNILYIGWFIYTPNMVKKDYPHWCCERTNKTKQ